MLADEESLPHSSRSPFRRWYALALLVLAPFVLFSPAFGYSLLQIDDVDYFLENPSLHHGALTGLRDLWGVVYFSDYSPISQLTIWLDLAIGHGDSFVFARVQQLVWLGLGTLGIVQVVFRISGRPGLAYAVGALYCLHPVTAESTLWLAERKNLVAFALTWWSISHHLAWRQDGRTRFALVSILLCALALLAKPQAVIIPGVIAAWEVSSGSTAWRNRLLAVAPTALMAIAFTVISITAIRWDLGNARLGGSLPGTLACDGAILLRYLLHAYVPQSLAIFYHVIEDPSHWMILMTSWICIFALVAFTLAIAQDRRLIAFAWSAAILSLAPAVNLTAQLLPMSDHYLQWALPFLLIIPCQLVFERIHRLKPLEWEPISRVALGGYAVLLALLSWARLDEFSSYGTAMVVGTRHQPLCGINWAGYCHSLVASASPDQATAEIAGRAGLTALRCEDRRRILARPYISSLIYGVWECQRTEGTPAADALLAQCLPQAGPSAPFAEGMVLLLEQRPLEAQRSLERDYSADQQAAALHLAAACRSGDHQPWDYPPCLDFDAIQGDKYVVRMGVGLHLQCLAALANAYRLNGDVASSFALSALLVNLVPRYPAALSLYRESCRSLGLEASVRRVDAQMQHL